MLNRNRRAVVPRSCQRRAAVGHLGWLLLLAAALAMPAACIAQAASSSAPAKSSTPPKLDRFVPSELDKSASPCLDFYEYVCKQWKDDHPIPQDMGSVGTWTPLYLWNQTILRDTLEKAAANPDAKGTERLIGEYWHSCMDLKTRSAKGNEWLAEALKPVDDLKSKADLAKLVAQLHLALAPAFYAEDNQTNTPFFGFGPTQDLKDSSKVVGGFDQGGLSLSSRDYYLNNDDRSKKVREQYKTHLVRMFKLAGDNEEQAKKEAEAVFAIEYDLAKAQMNAVDRRDPVKTYHTMSLAEVEKQLPDFNLAEYLKVSDAPKPPFYIVSTLEFFPAMDQQIKTRSLDELKSYLRWWVIKSAASRTSPELEEANFAFFGTELRGVPKMLPQWRRCVASTDWHLGEALGKEYVKVAFPPESKAKAVAMVKQVRDALKEDIGELDWMTPETKKQAIAKLNAMIDKIGYPNKWRDYSSVKVVPNNYMANLDAANAFEVRRQMNKINKPPDKMEWYMTPPTINAYNDPQNNTINFPAGILQLPYFNASLTDAENYGSMGATVGHEMTHGFDDQGRKFDAKGNLRDWWTKVDAKNYEERGACVAKENTHSVPKLGEGVETNGERTLGEDIADNGGVHLAMLALENLYKSEGKPLSDLDKPDKAGLTPRQLFYMNYAFGWCENTRPDQQRMQIMTDPHSLNRFRVNLVLSNQASFAKAFGCQAGEPMVREPACRVW